LLSAFLPAPKGILPIFAHEFKQDEETISIDESTPDSLNASKSMRINLKTRFSDLSGVLQPAQNGVRR
jgi:hypothetical protein